ncbi:uncharacterized protein LY79DRAFT_29553 [Colletotrichum navitas]|uniref:Uncharacterized protein n=1 Tax=Colletotrichum navitas TaxID=681940 RepID=A0AAD8VD17_9PEZI|nr:uncharacterized protein LY79DRAFT_29553 [Colletotrichum navitas]KAK1600708.1 hypothetical protein LY79DRAFT_29553 [Colletotrichum navitas]
MQEGVRSFLVVPCLPLLPFPSGNSAQHLGPAVQATVSPGSAVQQCKCQKSVSINHMSSIRQARLLSPLVLSLMLTAASYPPKYGRTRARKGHRGMFRNTMTSSPRAAFAWSFPLSETAACRHMRPLDIY